MKKAIALSLSIIMSMSMLCACSEDDDSSKKDKDSSAGSGNSSMVLRPLTPDSDDDSSKKDDSSKPQSDINHSVSIAGHDISFGDTLSADSSKWEKFAEDLKEDKIAFACTTSVNGIEMIISCYLKGDHSYCIYDIEGKKLTIFNKRESNEVYVLDDINKTYALFPEGEKFPDLGEKEILEHYQTMPDYGEYIETVEITIDGEEYVAECFELEGEYLYLVYDEAYTKRISLLKGGEMIGEIGDIAFYVEYEDYSYEIPYDYEEIPYEEAHANYQELFANIRGEEPDEPDEPDEPAASRYDELKAIINSKEYTYNQYLELSYDEYTYFFYTTDGEAEYYYADYPNGDILSLLDSPYGVYLFDVEDATYIEDAGYLPIVKDLKEKAEKYFTGEFVEDTVVTIDGEDYSADKVMLDGEYIFIAYDEADRFIAILIEDEKNPDVLTTLLGYIEAAADEDFTEIPNWFTEKK